MTPISIEMAKRIYWNRFMGKKLPENAKLVTRRSRYGNPYEVKKYGRAEAIRLYRAYLPEAIARGEIDITPLQGFDLACSCKPEEDCHADVLLEYLNQK